MKKNASLIVSQVFYAIYMGIGVALLVLILLVLPACSNDEGKTPNLSFPTALVTVKSLNDSTFVLQLDDTTRLYPTNISRSPYGTREVRALVNYSEERIEDERQYIHINWLDSIRTKDPVATAGTSAANDSLYGNDPIELVRDWVTIAEDGYLTLRVRTRWGQRHTPHYMNILTGTNPDNPYELELRHDARGDVYGPMGDALIAFDLNDLPRTDSTDSTDSPLTIKVKWQSFSGPKSTEFALRLQDTTPKQNYPRLEKSQWVK